MSAWTCGCDPDLEGGPHHCSAYPECVYGGSEFTADAPKVERTYAEFSKQVHELVGGTAAGKGYNNSGADGYNALYNFVKGVAGGDGHALGEIIYKVQRYQRKRNPEDILKVAAWAFLVWKHMDDGA